jgi:hypothetical protein
MENGKNQSLNSTQKPRNEFVRESLMDLCTGLHLAVQPERIEFYCKALDDLTLTQLEHGFQIAKRHLGTFLPSVEQLRLWAESWRPAGFESERTFATKADLQRAGVKLRVTKAEIAEWLEAGKTAQNEHIAKLEADPEWCRKAKVQGWR